MAAALIGRGVVGRAAIGTYGVPAGLGSQINRVDQFEQALDEGADISTALEASKLKRENRELKERSTQSSEMIGRSAAMTQLRQSIDKVARGKDPIGILRDLGSREVITFDAGKNFGEEKAAPVGAPPPTRKAS